MLDEVRKGWDFVGGSYATDLMDVGGAESLTVDLAVSADGTKAYVVGGTFTAAVYQYTLNTPWDISTGSYASKSMPVGGQETVPMGLAFSADGTKAYIVGEQNTAVYQYTLRTAWDISTGSYTSKPWYVRGRYELRKGLAFSPSGPVAYLGK